MYPELFRIGEFPISTFGLMLVAAFFAAYWQLRRGFAFAGVGSEEDAASLVVTGGLFGILGAKAYYAFLVQDWRALLERAGLVWYGGFLLAAVAVIWTLRRRQLPAWKSVDALALALALGYAVGRIGCLLVGDDYGVPTTLPWGVEFPLGSPPSTVANLRAFGVDLPANLPDSQVLAVHPTQIYETLMAFAVWAFGSRLWKRRPAAGVVGLTVLALLGVERFLVEFLRAKDDRFFAGLTLAQGISLGLILVAVLLLIRRRRAEP